MTQFFPVRHQILRNFSGQLNTDLVNVHNWLIANKLTLNDTKTEYMIIGSRYPLSNLESNPVITIGQSNIKKKIR